MAIKPRRIKPNTTTDYLGSWQVMNMTGSDIEKGKLVQIDGVNSSGAFLLVKPLDVGGASAGLVNAPKFVAGTKIPNGGSGVVRENFIVTKANTNGATVGDPVYASLNANAGDWQLATPPGSPTTVGIVVAVSATDGVVFLAPQARVGAA